MEQIKRKRNSKHIKESLFCLAMTGGFILQWFLFWVVGNIESIKLAFTYYDASAGESVFYPRSQMFTNFSSFFADLFTPGIGSYVLNGLYFQALGSFVCMPMGYMVSFIIYKKLKGSEFFKVILYLPSILSGMITGLLYQHFIESGITGFVRDYLGKDIPYLFSDTRYTLMTNTIYTLFIGFASGLLINLGTMSRIPTDLVEYGELEGLSLFQEFYLLTLPLIYPVLEVQCLGIFVNAFLNKGPLYVFYGGNAPDNIQTFGYYLFTSVYGGRTGEATATQAMYGYTSAANLCIGIISVPIVQGTKWLFDKFDPGAEF